jgi:hypothetical protein
LPVSYLCDSWETFLEDRCADCGQQNNNCYFMGIYLSYLDKVKYSPENIKKFSKDKYFLNTGQQKDYCSNEDKSIRNLMF